MKPGLMTFLQVVSNTARFFEINYVCPERLAGKLFMTFTAQPPPVATLMQSMAAHWQVETQIRARGMELDVTFWIELPEDELALLGDYARTVNAALYNQIA
jgi:hypothetical protein